jgi:hypothetical protein
VLKIDPPIRATKPKLVVDGGISTDTTAYKVRLTYSGNFTNSASFNIEPEDNAQVTISDNAGNSVTLISSGNGYYTTPNNNVLGTVGRSYQLKIRLPNGESYASYPEKILPTVPIAALDTIIKEDKYSVFNPTNAQLYINVNDPASTTNFYRWSGSGWHPRKATGVSCGFGCTKGEFCFQYRDYNDIYINSDLGINGNQLIKQLAYKSPIYWYGKHYVDIKQHSITREAHVYWKKLLDQQTRTGTTTDPLPSPVEGNIYNVNNPSELALGYFEASSTSHLKLILSPLSLTPVFLSQTAALFIESGECYFLYPNAVDIIFIPSGWGSAPIISF